MAFFLLFVLLLLLLFVLLVVFAISRYCLCFSQCDHYCHYHYYCRCYYAHMGLARGGLQRGCCALGRAGVRGVCCDHLGANMLAKLMTIRAMKKKKKKEKK